MNRPDSPTEMPMISGKLVIVTVALVALGGAAFSWWYRWQQSDEALKFWGPERGVVELLGDDRAEVELLRLAPAAAPRPEDEETAPSPPAILQISGQAYRVQQRLPGAEVQGLIHMRHALCQDDSFDFENRRAGDPPQWPYALRLTSASGETITILLDPASDRVGLLGGRSAILTGPIADNLPEYLEQAFQQAEGAAEQSQ